MKTISKSQYLLLKMRENYETNLKNETVEITDEEYNNLIQYSKKPIIPIDDHTKTPEEPKPTDPTEPEQEETYDYKDSDFGINGIGYKIISLEEKTVKVWILCIHDDVVIPNNVIYNNVKFKVTYLCGEYYGTGWGAPNTCRTITFNKYINMNNFGNELHNLKTNYFYVNEENPYMTAINGVLYNKDITKLLRYTNNNEEFIIPNSILELEDYCFSANAGAYEDDRYRPKYLNNDICKKIIFNDNIEILQQNTFSINRNLEYIKLSNKIKILPSRIFYSMRNLKEVILPYDLLKIECEENNSCRLPQEIENITIYNSNIINYTYIRHIKRWYGDGSIAADYEENSNIYVFGDLTNLQEIHIIDENPVELEKGIFTDGKYFTLKIYVPQGCKTIYENTPGWNKFYNIIELDE